MIITNTSYRLINESNTTKKIEQIARICYKSEDNITEDSDIKIINNLMNSGHTAMLEHANIILGVSQNIYERIRKQTAIKETFISKNDKNQKCYLRFSESRLPDSSSRYVISGNLRAWYEYFEWLLSYGGGIDVCLFDMVNHTANKIFSKFGDDAISLPREAHVGLLEPEELTAQERMVHECFTVVFITDLNTAHELVRMREASFAQEPITYCNYSKGKFGNEITFIKPCFPNRDEHRFDIWKDACRYAETKYFDLLAAGVTQQDARDVLPTSVKSEIAVTTNLNEWRHIFNLKACDISAHTQMREVMLPLLKEQKLLRPFAFGDLKIPECFSKTDFKLRRLCD